MAIAPRTLDPGEDFDDIEEFLDHLHHHLLACALTSALAPPIGQLLTDLQGHRAARRTLWKAVSSLGARKIFLDDALDGVLDEVKAALLADPSPEAAALYADGDFFGDDSPSAVRRYVLGPQLEKMRIWPGKLGTSPNPALVALGTKLTALIQDIDPVLQDLGKAESDLANFDVGPRAAFVEACNAAVKLAFGKLSELEHSPPQGPLPAGFVDRFFLRDTSGRAPRIGELEKAVERTRNKLKRQEEQLKALKEKRADELRQKQEADLADLKAQADAAKKAAEEAAAKLAAIQAQIEKSTPPNG